jgi:hypothetical protein
MLSMLKAYKDAKYRRVVEEVLQPVVAKALRAEVRHELEISNRGLRLSKRQLDSVVNITGWIASEAYWRGREGLVPPEF